MLNKVMIIGRLGADPELRYTQSGQAVCSLRVATDESYTDKDGNRVERTEWHSVVAFSKTADHCNRQISICRTKRRLLLGLCHPRIGSKGHDLKKDQCRKKVCG